MATISGTGISLTSGYYLRNFYTSNKNAATASKREEMSTNTLSQADAQALHRAAKKLRSFNYEDDTSDGSNIYASLSAFIETYNNAISSGSNSSDSSVERYTNQLKSLSKEYSSELSKIGITVNSDGSLTGNDNLLKSASISKVKTLFSDEADYLTKVNRCSKKICEKTQNLLDNGVGETINLCL